MSLRMRVGGMRLDFHITDEATGETVVYRDEQEYSEEWDDEDPNPTLFIWEEGNYSCDCNRRLFFERAKGNDPGLNQPCGETRYSVLGYDRITGSILFDGRRQSWKIK